MRRFIEPHGWRDSPSPGRDQNTAPHEADRALPTSPAIDSSPHAGYLTRMDVPITAEQESQLHELANSTGRGAHELVHEALSQYLNQEADLLASVDAGLSSLDRGDHLTHEAVGEQLKQILNRG